MRVTIVGAGMGTLATITREGMDALERAECLVGAARLLEAFPEDGRKRLAAVRPEEIAAFLGRSGCAEAAVLMSGDVGFYSGAKRLREELEALPEPPEIVCVAGVGSVQYFCARVGESWDDARLVSMHGREENAPGIVSASPKTFFLTGGENSAGEICRALCERGLGDVRVYVGENLSYPHERIVSGRAEELAGAEFDPLAVLLAVNENAIGRPVTHGLPDDVFLRGDVPMTKREVRTVSVSALRLRSADVVWDVGAGTGSVSVEIARLLPEGMVYAVEKAPAAVELLRLNRDRFRLANLKVVAGSAPAALDTLPPPDAVFIGGSSGALREIVGAALEKNPRVRIVVNAIMLETAAAALDMFAREALPDVEVVQLTAARAKSIGGGHMLLGQNPVMILSAGGVRE